MMRKLISWGAVVMVLGFLCASVASYVWQWHGWRTTVIEGVVLRQDSDILKQGPVSQAEVTATNGRYEETAKTDPSGYFKLQIRPSWQPQQTIKLLVRHANYTPLELPNVNGLQLYLLHLQPKDASGGGMHSQKDVAITDLRVRYSMKTTNTMNIGSTAKTFLATGEPEIKCDGKPPCSPDGKWKATATVHTFDAGEHTEFRNARISCIAGPCPFTRVASSDLATPHRMITVTVDNWSSTTTFLLEAEVTQTTESDMIREAYPVIFGSSMNFTLPASAEGPSVEASVDGLDIVFPLGPRLNLSWGECSGQQAAENARQYRCSLRPGYIFR